MIEDETQRRSVLTKALQVVYQGGAWTKDFLLGRAFSEVDRVLFEKELAKQYEIWEKRQKAGAEVEAKAQAQNDAAKTKEAKDREFIDSTLREAETDHQSSQEAWEFFWGQRLGRKEPCGDWKKDAMKKLSMVAPARKMEWLTYLANAVHPEVPPDEAFEETAPKASGVDVAARDGLY
jgi:hypothetical protein